MKTATHAAPFDALDLSQLSAAEVGDDHILTSVDTPLRPDAFSMSDTDKKNVLLFFLKKSCRSWDWI